MKATILTEDYAGMKSQAFGLAIRAGFETELCFLVTKGPWNKLSAPYWPVNPLRVVQPLQIDEAGILISVGSVGGVVGATLRSKSRPIIHIQNPRINLNRFDMVIANPHDNLSGKNVIISRNALHNVTSERLEQAKQQWSPFFASYSKPLVSVLIGGNNGRFKLGEKEAHILANQLVELIKHDGVGIALTPSRRTSPEAIQVFDKILSPLGAYVWTGKEENPYMGLLACANFILVTMDSVSMISEAIATSVPVMILPLPGKSKRIASFIHSMQYLNRIRLFSRYLEDWSLQPFDDTQMVVDELHYRLNLIGS